MDKSKFGQQDKVAEPLWKKWNPYVLVALGIWAMTMILLWAGDNSRHVLAGGAVIGPSSIFFCWYSIVHLIPIARESRGPLWHYLKWTFFLLLVAYVPVALLYYLLTIDPEAASALAFITHMVLLGFAVPLSWFIYLQMNKTSTTIRLLRTELRQSAASFDFLRSQINPHFLFNSLNTIYGLALQENAVNTSSAVEKLSGMMRFMLRENMETWIPLEREIEYLENYISLQKLRISGHSSIQVEVYIGDSATEGRIAPMLLIPFVENAFKHGISYRQSSYIRISLEVKDGFLQFDVANSKHGHSTDRDQRYEGGIGIENTKHRLKLLYGTDYELMIRESPRDYFVHLNLPVKTKNHS